ncbi:MAG: hypothetical protein IJZ42_01540 [Lachnospiraceae bacterium]|nr:hypothetical protein [Lachnospiraceae bacterium]
MEKLTTKVKTFYGYDIYELTEEENKAFRPGARRTDTPIQSYFPDTTFFVFEKGENFDTVDPILIASSIHGATRYCRQFPLNESQVLNCCIANKIFEEIGSRLGIVEGHPGLYTISEMDLAELKKKYAESESILGECKFTDKIETKQPDIDVPVEDNPWKAPPPLTIEGELSDEDKARFLDDLSKGCVNLGLLFGKMKITSIREESEGKE